MGFLFCFKYEQYGWLVIINNYFIQNDEEVKLVKVVFDYKNDDSKEGIIICEVLGFVCILFWMKDGEDEIILDFSVFVLKFDKNMDKLFLKYCMMFVMFNIIVSFDLLEMCGFNFLLIIVFFYF